MSHRSLGLATPIEVASRAPCTMGQLRLYRNYRFTKASAAIDRAIDEITAEKIVASQSEPRTNYGGELPARETLANDDRVCGYCGRRHPVSASVAEESPFCAACLEERVQARAAGWAPGRGSPIGADEAAQAKAWNETADSFDDQLRKIVADPTRSDEEREAARWQLEGADRRTA